MVEHNKNLISNLNYQTPRDLVGIFFSSQTTCEQKKAIWKMRKLVVETITDEVNDEVEVPTGEYVETLEDGTYIHRDKYSQERAGDVTDSNYTYWNREKKVSDWDGNREKYYFTKTEKRSYTETKEITLEEVIRNVSISRANLPSERWQHSGGCAGPIGIILIVLVTCNILGWGFDIYTLTSAPFIPIWFLFFLGVFLFLWSIQDDIFNWRRKQNLEKYIESWINTPPSNQM